MNLDDRLEMATDAELKEMLEDAEGEAGSCSDGDCGCQKVAWRIEDEIVWRLEGHLRHAHSSDGTCLLSDLEMAARGE